MRKSILMSKSDELRKNSVCLCVCTTCVTKRLEEDTRSPETGGTASFFSAVPVGSGY